MKSLDEFDSILIGEASAKASPILPCQKKRQVSFNMAIGNV